MAISELDSIYQLPVFARREQILKAVDDNQVTIITAETGAGKSTQIPQYLAEHGYSKIIVTQPRILAARNLCHRVRQEYSYRLSRDASSQVGYRTAHERDDSPDNVILYCTDGLQLVREITGSGTTAQQVLILDEVHEWNENMEVLIAWAKKRCQEEPLFKIVIMSATIESTSLAEYYGTAAPIAIEGRSFPVVKRHGSDLITEIVEQTQRQVSNILVFLPGKSEIEKVAEAIRLTIGDGIPILPLHSQLEPEVQQAAFDHYPNGKIVLSTNIAQTSVTINDIDIVIDSGLERRAEVRSGVEGLFIEETSQADCKQRAGRAGRTKPGTYILAQLENLPCTPEADRSEYGIPEILRKHIDRLVLRLASINIDIEQLEFFHAPSRKAIKFAKQTLIRLGALTTDQRVTNIGREMEQFPVESSYARMLVEAKKFPPAIQVKIAAMIAIQEVGGIIRGGPRYSGWRTYVKQSKSDLIAQYEVYLASSSIDELEFEELGIIPKNIDKAGEIIARLQSDLNLNDEALCLPLESEVIDLLKCIIAGQLHQVWAIQPDGKAVHIVTGKEREISSSSVVKQAELVTGTPFDLQVPTPEGLQILKLVNNLTIVDPAWLVEISPQDYTLSPGKTFYNPQFGTLARKTQLQHGSRLLEIASTPILERTQENSRLFGILYGVWIHDQLEKQRHSLQAVNKRRIPEVPLKQIQQQVRHIAEGAVSLYDMSKQQKVQLARLAKLETHLPQKLVAGLQQPDETRHRHGFRRHIKFRTRQNSDKFRPDRRNRD